MTKTTTLCFAALLSFAPVASVFATDSAKPTLNQAVSEVRKAVESKAAADSKRRTLHGVLVRLVDFNNLAERSLGDHWQRLNSKQRKDFSQLLQSLVEASYIAKLGEANSVDIQLSDEKQDEDSPGAWTIGATAKVKGQDVELVFHMAQRDGRWLVNDVEVDDVSIVHNYHTQFSKVIAKSSFVDLETKIRKKLAEIKSESTANLETASRESAKI